MRDSQVSHQLFSTASQLTYQRGWGELDEVVEANRVKVMIEGESRREEAMMEDPVEEAEDDEVRIEVRREGVWLSCRS